MTYQFHYIPVHIDKDEVISDKLNEYGKNGWRLHSVVPTLSDGYTRYFTAIMEKVTEEEKTDDGI